MLKGDNLRHKLETIQVRSNIWKETRVFGMHSN
jgi:hypothetical protein